jgi:hypothetical protein
MSFLLHFSTLICSDLQLICNPQITANQTPLASKKHVKTRANHCKSLTTTPPKNLRKTTLICRPQGRVDLVSMGTESAFFV